MNHDFREPRLILNLNFKDYPIKDEIIICIKGTSIKGIPVMNFHFITSYTL